MPRKTAPKLDLPMWKIKGYDDAQARIRVQGEAIRRSLPLLRRIQDLNDVVMIHALAHEITSLLTSQWKVEESMNHITRVLTEVIALADKMEALFPGSITNDPEITALLAEMKLELERERSQAESLGH